MTNPIEIIKRDHRKVEELFKEYEDLGERAFETKARVVENIIRELRLHAEMEEVLFYPRAEEALNKEDGKMVEEAYAEHEVAKRLLEELSVTHPEDPQFDAKVKVLNENVAHHIMEEEKELMPRLEEKLSEEDMNEIGEEMKAFKLENTDNEN
jgi:hemerythrin-like domain-containing protein